MTHVPHEAFVPSVHFKHREHSSSSRVYFIMKNNDDHACGREDYLIMSYVSKTNYEDILIWSLVTSRMQLNRIFYFGFR